MLKCNEFLVLAERDRKLCRLVERDFPEPYAVSAAAFHMQQAIEKLLKGLILMYGEEPACTYSITKLIGIGVVLAIASTGLLYLKWGPSSFLR